MILFVRNGLSEAKAMHSGVLSVAMNNQRVPACLCLALICASAVVAQTQTSLEPADRSAYAVVGKAEGAGAGLAAFFLGLDPFMQPVDEVLSMPLAPAETARLQWDRSFRPGRLRFERNEGQVAREVQFLVRGYGNTIFFTATEAVILMRSTECGMRNLRDWEFGAQSAEYWPRRAVADGRTANWRKPWERPQDRFLTGGSQRPKARFLRMKLAGSNPGALVAGEEELPGRVNYFIGNEPGRWHTNIATYAQVRFREVYPGIDLVYYGNDGQLEYDFIVAPGANPKAIALTFEGADRVVLDDHQDLLVQVGQRELRWRQPKVYQRINGVRREVAGNYILQPSRTADGLRMTHHVSFQLAAYDAALPVTIDPVLVYSTYLGGTGGDQAYAIAADSQGNAYVTGATWSFDFPTKNAFQDQMVAQPGYGINHVFLTKLGPAGELIYSTYLGGAATPEHMWSNQSGNAIAVDSAGSAYVTGYTDAPDFPAQNAIQPENPAAQAVPFVTKFSPDGSALSYSTYLSGTSVGVAYAIAVDGSGNAYLGGRVLKAGFPIANALQPQYSGGSQGTGFITKLDPSGTHFIYSTYFGGSGGDAVQGIAVDKEGNAYVVGDTGSTNLPLKNAVQPQLAGKHNGFFAKVSSNGSELMFSSYWGGSNADSLSEIALGQDGDIYLAGRTTSMDFPVVSALQPHNAGAYSDAVVLRVKPDGRSIVFSTYFGGSGNEYVQNPGLAGSGLALDPAGNVCVSGTTDSQDLPLAEPLQPAFGGGNDAFLAVFSPDGSKLLFSTYLGGSGYDPASSVASDPLGNIYLAGFTDSQDFPILNAMQPGLANYPYQNVFVTKFRAIDKNRPLASGAAMQVARSGDSLLISWPVNAGSFQLEETEALVPTAQWISAVAAPVLTGDQNVVTVGVASAGKFYRLRKL